MKLSIIIPIYNERGNLLEILRRVEEADTLGMEKEIILVDDGSTDGTREILKNLEKKYLVIYHAKNQGKGRAIRSGLEKAGGDLTLIQDADLEYNPQNYPRLFEPILEKKAEIIFGSRYLKKTPKAYKVYLEYYWGGRLTNWLLNLLYSSHLTDSWTCYKVFKTPVLKSLNLESNRFEIEVEMVVKALKKKYKILEVPIDYSPRTFKEGKKIRSKDGLIGAWKIIKYRFT